MATPLASKRRALERLGVDRFRAFLEAANDGGCLAVKLFCDDLATGANPAEALLDPAGHYSLSVRKSS